ncbi:hypothetical protein F5Y09DRAFT_313343 [Xylaria sp. FL1042]|nr:hypothetical protein F5Y09DRAFT_313343 [Xylaria sp. FL1042]
MGNSAIAVRSASRSSPTPIGTATGTQDKDTRTFRERFISSFETKPAIMSPAPTPVLASNATTTTGYTNIPITGSENLEYALSKPAPSILPSATTEDSTVPKALKTLKDSRWASDDFQDDNHPPASKGSRPANDHAKDGPKRNQQWVKPDKRTQPKKEHWRNASKHSRKTPKDSGGAKEEEETPREPPHEPPRLHMDMEEFKRDVEKYNLKTLKDSRWA